MQSSLFTVPPPHTSHACIRPRLCINLSDFVIILLEYFNMCVHMCMVQVFSSYNNKKRVLQIKVFLSKQDTCSHNSGYYLRRYQIHLFLFFFLKRSSGNDLHKKTFTLSLHRTNIVYQLLNISERAIKISVIYMYMQLGMFSPGVFCGVTCMQVILSSYEGDYLIILWGKAFYKKTCLID